MKLYVTTSFTAPVGMTCEFLSPTIRGPLLDSNNKVKIPFDVSAGETLVVIGNLLPYGIDPANVKVIDEPKVTPIDEPKVKQPKRRKAS